MFRTPSSVSAPVTIVRSLLTPPTRLGRLKSYSSCDEPLSTSEPSVKVPTLTTLPPGDTPAPSATVAAPATVPVPPSVAPVSVVTLPPTEPFTSSVPPATVVIPV